MMSPALERFITRFQLVQPNRGERLSATINDWKPAAVLIPIVDRPSGMQVLLTERSQTLRHHPGQISFPGGRQDPEDRDLAATALRETQEELGIPATDIRLLGRLPEHQTVSRYRVTPYVGLLVSNYPLRLSTTEVAEAFELPLMPFLDNRRYGNWTVKRQGQSHPVFGLTVEGRLVWGATARMLWQLARLVRE